MTTTRACHRRRSFLAGRGLTNCLMQLRWTPSPPGRDRKVYRSTVKLKCSHQALKMTGANHHAATESLHGLVDRCQYSRALMVMLFARSASFTNQGFGSVADNFNQQYWDLKCLRDHKSKTGHESLSVRTDRALTREWYCTFCEDIDSR